MVIALAVGPVTEPRTLRGCTVPVFHYALQHWPPEDYDVFVFHRGPLSPSDARAVDRLTDASRSDASPANCRVHRVNVDAIKAGPVRTIWNRHKNGELPRVVVRYPRQDGRSPDVWAAKLNAQTVERILRSPARRQIVERLATDAAAVWVLLESGSPADDKGADLTLQKELDKNGRRLSKPTPTTAPAAQNEPTDSAVVPGPVTFSVVRVRRDDPAEEVFVEMLLGSEPDLRTFRKPMAFPVFGRGRLLHALVGKGISPAMIAETCEFVVGPCPCQVKDLNPGVDLLMCADWDRAAAKRNIAASEMPFTLRTTTDNPGRLGQGGPMSSTSGPVARSVAFTLGILSVAILGTATVIWRRSSRAGQG